MNTRIATSCLLSLAAVLAMLALFTISCGPKGDSAKPADVDYYTCTMHPSVKSQDPKGKCPICGMDLVPVMKKGAVTQTNAHDHTSHSGQMPGMPMEAAGTNATEQPAEFTVPVERQQQIG